jgi:hypothetical protein
MPSGMMGCYGLTGPYNITLNADPANFGKVRFNTIVHDQFPWTGTYFGGMDNIFEAMPDTMRSFINWTSNSQVFQPNDSTALVKVNLVSNDSIVAHFDYATAVYGMNQTVPIANVYPTVIDEFTQLDFSLPEATAVDIQLVDINGKIIRAFVKGTTMQSGFHSMQLSIPAGSLQNGIYLLQLRAGYYSKSFKLIKAN